jgi:hypothetical protein
MRELLGSIIGVPATILIAAGGGIALVTVVSRIRRKRVPPIRWAHGLLGVGMTGLGVLLFALDINLVGLR